VQTHNTTVPGGASILLHPVLRSNLAAIDCTIVIEIADSFIRQHHIMLKMKYTRGYHTCFTPCHLVREAISALSRMTVFQCCVFEVSHIHNAPYIYFEFCPFSSAFKEGVTFSFHLCIPFLQSASWSRSHSGLADKGWMQRGTSHSPVCPWGLSYPTFPAPRSDQIILRR
jgi:hypothetical protein